jgi:uncharacterized protein (TIGR02757 family)
VGASIASRAPARRADLKGQLDRLYREFDHPNSATDPIHIVRRYTTPADREVVGFIAAGLAFGRVASVLNSIESVLAVLGPSPAAFIRAFDPERDDEGGPNLRSLGHRWIRGNDLVALVLVLQDMLNASTSLEGFFTREHDASTPDIGDALDSFSRRACAVDLRPAYGRVPAAPGVRYFFPRPRAGSACKRLNLFLRWMVRRDEIDLGVWSRVPAAQLIVPLDTHVIRVGRCLRLTKYRSPGWRMAADITASLRRLDPVDPVKYDFSLCHLGMMGSCGYAQRKRDKDCPLRGLCHPHGRS